MKDKAKALDAFLTTFLPPQNNKRKYRNNELDSIHSTLNPIFKKYLGIELGYVDLMEAFARNGYTEFEMYSLYNPDVKASRMTTKEKGKPIKQGTMGTKGIETYDNYICFNVSASQVKALDKTISKLPPNTCETKVRERAVLVKQLERFFNELKSK